VEHEGEPLGRLERVQHDEEREAHRVGEHRLGLAFPLTDGDDRIGQTHLERILASRRPRSQHVEAHRRDDGRQPAPETRDVARIGPAQPNPGFLDGILGFAGRPEHAIRHRAQVRPVFFESISERLGCRHRSPSPVPALPGSDRWKALPEAEQRAIYADYAELDKTEGITGGLPLGLPHAAETVQVRDGNSIDDLTSGVLGTLMRDGLLKRDKTTHRPGRRDFSLMGRWNRR